MLVLDVLALRSFEKRFVDASLGDAPLRRAFVNGAPVECSSAQFPNYVTATRARALEAAPFALRALTVNDALWEHATSKTSDIKMASQLPSMGDGGEWVVLGDKLLPFICSIGTWRGTIMIVFRSTSSESEALRADLGEDLIAKFGYFDATRILRTGLPLPCPPQAAMDGIPVEVNSEGFPLVHAGFFSAYVHTGLEKKVLSEVKKQIKASSASPAIAILGHSLGAGLAAVCAARGLHDYRKLNARVVLSLIVTACPKPGNAAFRDLLANSGIDCVCFANEGDPIPWLPFSIMPNPLSKKGTLAYAMLPGTFILTSICPSLILSHSSMTYRACLRRLLASKDEL